jgi:HAD superfamily hydrolase (TIGR01458 family)
MPSSSIHAVLIDLSGTLHIGDQVIPGAVQAVQRLRDAGKRVRFLTNTSTTSSTGLLQKLHDMGFHVAQEELLTSVLATRNYLMQHNLRPFCIMEDTSDLSNEALDLTPPHNCVVVGLAPTKFNYENLNQAFRVLLKHPKLVAIHRAKYLRDTDGQLSLGPGGFVAGLETAATCEAVVMGKPSRDFFESALWSDIPKSEVCMIGDDMISDIQGARDAGIGTSILVQTGKYRSGDEDTLENAPTITCPSFIEAVDFILQSD